jgi:DNA-binding transcriptional regulator YiaG
MNRRKPNYYRNSLDLRDKVQVKILRKRLKLSDDQFANIFRKSEKFDFRNHQGSCNPSRD